MDHPLFETPRPDATADQAERLVAQTYGVNGTATPLEGERDRNYRIAGPDGAYVLRIGNHADDPKAVEMQSLAMEHALARDPGLPIPRVVRTLSGEPVGHHVTGQGVHPLQLVTFLDGIHPGLELSTPAFRRSVATVVARFSRAVRGFDHPALRRHLLWDVGRLLDLRPQLEFVDPAGRQMIARRLDLFERQLAPVLAGLPHQLVYGDAHAGNLLVDPHDPDRVTALVDFGDSTRGAKVLDAAITASYQVFGAASDQQTIDALVQVAAAYHAVDPLDETELGVFADLAASRLVQSFLISSWRSKLHPDNAEYILSDAEAAFAGVVAIDRLDPRAVVTELRAVCGMGRPRRRPLPEAVARRSERLGPALSLSYEDPVRLDSADGVWLFDTDGNRLLDAYNNVPHVGHCHPQVTSAIAHQVRRLTTNTRYLVDEVGEYADKLVDLLPGDLSVVMFVNSGSEANDVAYQIARVVTGRRGLVIGEHAYHGTTFVTSMMSPEELGLAKLEPWVAHVGGAATLGAPDPATRVAAEVDAAVGDLIGRGEAPAMLILDDVFSSDGIFAVPPGYLASAYRSARAAGALVVADEVQAGFGRVGSPFWGFAQDGVIPDMVTLGKPMGNGHPMGAVITTPAIAAEFAAGWHFFSTFAGSPVAAAAGTAVLDVLRREGLPERADEVGDHLRAGIRRIGHPAVVDVRGPGQFTGVQLSDATVARTVVEGLRRRGVLVGRTGVNNDVVKVRPPLVFSTWHADLLIQRLAEVLDTVG